LFVSSLATQCMTATASAMTASSLSPG
jgi:hypothetical protein